MSTPRIKKTIGIFIGLWAILVPQLPFAASSPQAVDKSLKIAMLVWRGETEAEQGFKDALQTLGYRATFRVLNAQQDQKSLADLLHHEVIPQLDAFDYIYTFGTTVSKMTRGVIRDQIPQVFNVVTDPVGAGIVESLQAPGGRISGATNRIPIRLQLEAALKLFSFQRLGLLFNPREKNSMIERQQLYAVAKQLHLEVIDLRSPPVHDMLQMNLQKLKDKSIVVDAVYLPSDSYMVSQAVLIGAELRAAHIPSIGSIDTFVEYGALVGVVADYYQLGQAVGRIVHRHQQGEPLGRIAVHIVREPLLVFNNTAIERFKLNIPDAVLKDAVIVK